MVKPTIRIRMYAVGFGDCFLLGFPDPKGGPERLMLIDCGVHNASQRGAKIFTEVIPNIVAEASAATGKPRIDVVVVSHHHLDHVSGFQREGWDEVEVGEVWLPWTEDPDDPEAQKIRAAQSKQAKFLLGLDPGLSKKWQTVRLISDNNVGYTNGPAMTTLQDGFAGVPPRSYLPEPVGKPRSRRFSPPVIPGLEVVVLGPSRDEAAIRDMNPPSSESYFRLDPTRGGRNLGVGGDLLPFAPFFVEPERYAEEHKALVPPHKSDFANIAKAGRTDALALAIALEQATNGTSLVLLLRFGDTTMLFPGDAQWGTWDRMLHDPETEDLLRIVNFYKVGHHGSHNATPVTFVTKYLHDADASMVSVAPTGIETWKDIPKDELLAALATKSAIVLDSDMLREAARAGKPAPSNADVTEDGKGLWTEIKLPVTR
jgi:hypothetical protein